MSEETRRIEQPEQEDGQVDLPALLDDIFAGFARHFALVLACVSLCASLCFWLSVRRYEPLYRVNATYIVTPNYAVNYNSTTYDNSALRQIIKSFPYVVQNGAMQSLIAKDLGRDSVPGRISVSSVEATNAFTIAVTAASPDLAYNILQSVTRNYPQIAKDIIGDTTLTMMSDSGIPTSPINGNDAKRAAMIGVLAVLALFAAAFAGASLLKKTIRKESDFGTFLNVKCFGSVPKATLKRKGGNDRRIRIDNKRVSYEFRESVRTLRTRTERLHTEHGAQVFLISSAIAGEGKSTVAANLALSLAARGKKAILLDMDLRNASALKTLGISGGERGLAELLAGRAAAAELLITDPDSGLMILSGGNGAARARDLLADPGMEKVFAMCRNLADYVIVDTPPSSILADASDLVRFADRGIFVVRQDYAPMEKIRDGIDILYDSGLEIAGCVLNYTQGGFVTRYSYGGYGYGHYGRYGRTGRYGKYGKYGNYGTGKAEEAEDEKA